jgi:hypothetical protein
MHGGLAAMVWAVPAWSGTTRKANPHEMVDAAPGTTLESLTLFSDRLELSFQTVPVTSILLRQPYSATKRA